MASSRATRAVETVLGFLGLATALHLWGGVPNALGLRVQTAFSTTAWRAAEALERLPGFEEVSDVLVLVRGTLLAVVVGAMLWVGRTGGLRAVPGHVTAAVPLLGLLAVVVYGAGLAPTAFLATVALSAFLGRRTEPGPAPRFSLGAAWVGCVAFLLLHALYVSGPGIQPALVADGGIGGWVSRLVEPLTGSTWLKLLAQGVAVASSLAVSVLLQRRGIPLVPRWVAGPAGWLPPVAQAAVIAIACGAPVQVLSVWKCPTPAYAGPTRVIDARPGSFQLHVVDGGAALWSVDREAAVTRRWALPTGRPLPDIDWRSVRPDAWPEEQIPAPGAVWSALVDPEIYDASVLVRVDDHTGQPTGQPVVTDGCYVASSAMLPTGELLLGCEYTPEFLVLDAETGAIHDRFVVPEAGSFEEIVLSGDVAYAVPLWFGASLTRVDLQDHRALGSTFLGDFNWGATQLDGTLLVTRFQEGRVQSVDMESGAVLDAVHVGYGTRPVVVRPGTRWVIAAGTYSGTLAAAELADDGTFADPVRLPVGGLVRSLAPSPDGRFLYFAGRCGVRSLDLAAWLGDAS